MIILILSISARESYAQLKFDNLQPFELEVSGMTDLSGSNYWRLSPSDRDISTLFGISDLSEEPAEEGHFIVRKPENTYLAYRSSGMDESQILRFRIENHSGRIVDKIEVSLDLAFLTDGQQPSEISLVYSLDNHRVEKRLFRSSQFRERSDEWVMASMTALLENLLMEKEDVLEVKLIAKGVENFELADAVGIQRMVFNPLEIEYRQDLSTGDLIVTEIFPGSRIENEPLHYIEIYNSTYGTVDLRGLLISNGSEDYRIRTSLEIEPYQFAVIANRSLSQSDFNPDLQLPGFWLPSHGGMVELISSGNRILRAAYDEQTESRSWEIRHMEDALDGYISMTHYRQSEQQIASGFYGSPGNAGSSERVFTRNIDENHDWQLIGSPGILKKELRPDRSYRSESIGLTGSGTSLPSGTGVLLKSDALVDSEASSMLVAVENREMTETEIKLEEGSENSLLLLGNPYPETIRLGDIQPVEGSLDLYSGQIWDPATGSFRLINPDDRIEPWQAFIIQNRNAEALRISRDRQTDRFNQSYESYRSRYIQFALRTNTSNRGRSNPNLTDEAAMLFFHENAENGSDEFQAVKLWPVFQHQSDVMASLLYFVGQNNNRLQPLARSSRPYNPENTFTVSLGHVALNVSGSHTLSWEEWYNIPDDWEITLEDQRTGTKIDMREQNYYTFEASGIIREMPRFSDEPALHPLELDENYERFTLRINPAPHLTESEEQADTGPDRVELYQNYPNPFNPATNIRFFLPEQQSVSIGVYNVVGQRVAQLMDDVLSQGEHTVVWDATDMPSGIYIIHLEFGNRVLTRKMTLIK